MKGTSPVDRVIEHKRAARHRFPRRHPQDRRMATLSTAYPQPVTVQESMDRSGQFLILLVRRQGLPGESLQLRLDLKPHPTLDLVEILLHAAQQILRIGTCQDFGWGNSRSLPFARGLGIHRCVQSKLVRWVVMASVGVLKR